MRGVSGRPLLSRNEASESPGSLGFPNECRPALCKGEAALAAQNSVLVQIARPYASALFDLARSENRLSDIEASLAAFLRLSGESEDFSRFLRSPAISSDQKSRALDAILDRIGTDTLLGNFLRLVARNGRLFALTAIIAEFRRLAAANRGEIAADVTSAVPLTRDQIAALTEALRSRVGKTVTLNEHIDPSLIGGLQVKVGSQMIDSSLKTKLSAMKMAMKEVG